MGVVRRRIFIAARIRQLESEIDGMAATYRNSLAAQVAAQAAIDADTELRQVCAQHFGLANTDGR